jgi:hypothetical protein
MTLLATASSRRFHFGYCSAIFLASALSVFPFLATTDRVDGYLPKPTYVMAWLISSVILALMMKGFASVSSRRPWVVYLIPIGLLGVGILRALPVFGLRRLSEYGDSNALGALISTAAPDFERWLLGVTLLRNALAISNFLELGIEIGTFVRASGSIVMFCWAMWIIRVNPNSVAAWLVTTSPIWILFSIGYDEYYPFVAGLMIAVCVHTLSSKGLFQSKTSYILTGLMPALYIGAIPISLALLLRTWADERDWSARSKGLGLYLITAAIAIEVGGDFNLYIANLTPELLPESGGARSGDSIFLSVSHALSLDHLTDIWFWISCGSSGFVLWIASHMTKSHEQNDDKSALGAINNRNILRHGATVGLILLAAVFLLFMNPLNGPTRDIDLYFWTMAVLLLTSGFRFDRSVAQSSNPVLAKQRVMTLAAFGFAPATTALVVFGVAR